MNLRSRVSTLAASIFFAASMLAVFPSTGHSADLNQDSFNKAMNTYLESEENLQKLGDSLQNFFQKKQMERQKAAMEEERSQLEDQFKNPVKIDIGSSPSKGPKDAPITIVEFSDFQCPYCKKGADTMDEVMAEYPDKVKLVFKNLPLPFHSEAQPAARAALAAGRQDKFWEMHDLLFNNQQALGEELYVKLAGDLKLDVEKFRKDWADPALAKQVEDDAELATKLGVRGTPGFFVNGVQLRGAQPLPQFKEIIDRWLKQ